VRIALTEKCDTGCRHCFNAASRRGREMDADALIRFIRSIERHRPHHYLIMGGEPTLHPRIGDILYETGKAPGITNLFTNGNSLDTLFSDRGLLALHARGKLRLTINLHALDLKKLTRFHAMLRPSYTLFHSVVSMRPAALSGKMAKILSCNADFRFLISPDTTLNLFDDAIREEYRRIWTDFLVKMQAAMRKNFAGIDHHLPFCFYTEKMLQRLSRHGLAEPALRQTGCEGHNELGLIQPDFSLYYCNQTPLRLGSLLKNGTPVPYREITGMLRKGPGMKKKAIVRSRSGCSTCPSLDQCLAGCYFRTACAAISVDGARGRSYNHSTH
jgi:sulfatase maturation enzyme AslB (radical SAM superfamily)